jgi:nicotinate-nucleotide adenylyltransferase
VGCGVVGDSFATQSLHPVDCILYSLFMNQTQRIGILGGSFNPVHLGHLIMARDAIELFDLSRVMFIPCFAPPHKKSSVPIDPKHRVAMLENAVEDDLCIEISNIEIERGGISYAIDTISAVRKQFPDSELFFIIGTDTLLELHTWKDIYTLLEMCTFITIGRPGFNASSIKPEDLNLNAPWPESLLQNLAAGHGVDISSSDVRYRIAEGMNIRYLVPDSVGMYIAEHNLYTI